MRWICLHAYVINWWYNRRMNNHNTICIYYQIYFMGLYSLCCVVLWFLWSSMYSRCDNHICSCPPVADKNDPDGYKLIDDIHQQNSFINKPNNQNTFFAAHDMRMFHTLSIYNPLKHKRKVFPVCAFKQLDVLLSLACEQNHVNHWIHMFETNMTVSFLQKKNMTNCIILFFLNQYFT